MGIVMPSDLKATDLLLTESQRGVEKGAFSLLVVRGAETSTHPLRQGKNLIGRAHEAQVRIDHGSISREHAMVHVESTLRIEDLGSANGTRLRGVRLERGVPVEALPDDVIDLGAVLLVVRSRGTVQGQRRTNDGATFELRADEVPAGIVVRDEVMVRVFRLLKRIADSALAVLLLGETGVGKEVCAKLIHDESPRSDKPFLALNCAALSESLLESELFGYEKGAFTGAATDKPGLLESASGGTVFLDEVGDMPLATQVKLLRVLEAKEVLRLGSRKARRIDIRLVAATNRDLQERIADGSFREDLFYRLNGISVIVPPLRERPDDIEALARHFIECSKRPGGALSLSVDSVRWLASHPWPGNVRELRNLIERAVVLCDEPVLEPRHLPLASHAAAGAPRPAQAPEPSAGGLRHEVKSLEKERIEAALAACGGSQRRAAERLGISRGALLRRIDQLGISRPKKGS